MQTFVSYVIQDGKSHKHESTVITSESPSYSFSAEPQVSDVFEWAKNKKKTLKKEEELIVVGMYKL